MSAAQGRTAEASDLFDIYLSLVRHEQQRGMPGSAHVRRPGRELDLHETPQAGRLIARQGQRLQEMH